ncbi:LuxR C-terminal-related transcriptional regulator [Kribbella sp. NPDC051620]|uniref:LuxR C-terminal-related transcriptional regulator n=1 Tax=Kribbella sp. NPDC051620 TaxID=3364120 RepID=UPI0037A3C856
MTVLIVAPNQVVRAGVRTLVDEQGRIEVAGAVAGYAEAAAVLRSRGPEVLLVDTTLGRGIVDLVRVRDSTGSRSVSVVALVTGDVPTVAELREYVAAGVDGIVSTAEDIGASLLAIRSGQAPGGWISPTLGADILRHEPPVLRPLPDDDKPVLRAAHDLVTPSEHEVLRLVADGHTDREIATRLHRSERVVKFHVSNLLAKLQARNRAHVVKLALRTGLLPTACPCGQVTGGRTTRVSG